MRCSKCDGSGYLSDYEHIQNGRCFDCNGTGHAIIRNNGSFSNGQPSGSIEQRELKDKLQLELDEVFRKLARLRDESANLEIAEYIKQRDLLEARKQQLTRSLGIKG